VPDLQGGEPAGGGHDGGIVDVVVGVVRALHVAVDQQVTEGADPRHATVAGVPDEAGVADDVGDGLGRVRRPRPLVGGGVGLETHGGGGRHPVGHARPISRR
jgi:hypothetical protein